MWTRCCILRESIIGENQMSKSLMSFFAIISASIMLLLLSQASAIEGATGESTLWKGASAPQVYPRFGVGMLWTLAPVVKIRAELSNDLLGAGLIVGL